MCLSPLKYDLTLLSYLNCIYMDLNLTSAYDMPNNEYLDSINTLDATYLCTCVSQTMKIRNMGMLLGCRAIDDKKISISIQYERSVNSLSNDRS